MVFRGLLVLGVVSGCASDVDLMTYEAPVEVSPVAVVPSVAPAPPASIMEIRVECLSTTGEFGMLDGEVIQAQGVQEALEVSVVVADLGHYDSTQPPAVVEFWLSTGEGPVEVWTEQQDGTGFVSYGLGDSEVADIALDRVGNAWFDTDPGWGEPSVYGCDDLYDLDIAAVLTVSDRPPVCATTGPGDAECSHQELRIRE